MTRRPDPFDDPVGDWRRGEASSAARDFADLHADQLAAGASRRVPGAAKAVQAALFKLSASSHPHPDDPDYLRRLWGPAASEAPHFYPDDDAFKAASPPFPGAAPPFRPKKPKKPKRKKAGPAGLASYERKAAKLRERYDGSRTGSPGLDFFVDGGTVDLYATLATGQSVAADPYTAYYSAYGNQSASKGLWLPAVAKSRSRQAPTSQVGPDPYVSYYAACGHRRAAQLLLEGSVR